MAAGRRLEAEDSGAAAGTAGERELSKELESFLDCVGDAIYVVEVEDGRIRDCNAGACRDLGYRKDELLELSTRDIESELPAAAVDAVHHQLKPGEVRTVAGVHRRKDGSSFPVEIRLSSLAPAHPGLLISVVRDVTERKKIEDTRAFLVESGAKGEDFFRSLAQYLARSLDMDCVCIDRLEGDLLTARTVAVYSDGAFEDNVSYALHDTPCGEVVGRDVCCFADGVRQRFPKDAVLQVMRAESYVGVTLWSHTHQPIGLIAVIGRRPLKDEGLAESVLKLAAVRAASELERRLAEEELRLSEEKYRSLFENSEIAMFRTRLDGSEVLDVNQKWLELVGKTREQAVGKPSVIVWEDPKEREKMVGRLLADGSVSELEFNMLNEKKGVRNCVTSLRLYREQGILEGSIADITERKQAETKIRESEQLIRTILDTVDEGFLVIDRDYRILSANKAYCAQVARACDEVIGRRCHEISHCSPVPCFEAGGECAVREVFATGKPHASLHKHPGPDGQEIHVETKAYPLKDAAGGVVSVIETISDVTGKHLLEGERLKTQKLESIGTLAGGIAHDFNNLLQGVFGYIAMAKMTFDQRDKSLALLEQAEKALHQSVNLTTQLLTFSKGGRPVKKRISLLPVIENSVAFALSGSRSQYRITSDPGLWQVEADEGQLGQVIQNIVLNADQAMPLGGSVAISALNLPASGETRPPFLDDKDYVLVSIQDSGVGIPAQYLGKVFDPYFTTKEKGSGLGLATTYSIIRNHGGMIDVRSEVGKGSTFLIYLPALGTVPETPRRDAVRPGTRPGRILVMDDEELVRDLAESMLTALGHSPAFAEKGETALEVYRTALAAGRPFDAVILDLTIRGGMGGEETMKKLLEIDPGVKAVVSSGYSADETLQNYLNKGFKAVLNKPYTLQELKRTLDSLLG